MPNKVQSPKSVSSDMSMPLIGGLCMIGLIIALYFTFISGEPGFSEFSSMSVFP